MACSHVNLPSPLGSIALKHLKYHCGGNRYVYISLYKLVCTSVVRHSGC